MDVIETIFPILAIALVGYGVANRGYLKQQECDAISKFVFSYLIPSLLFIATAKVKIPDNMEWTFLFSYYFSVLVVYLIGACLGRAIFKYNPSEQSVFGMGSAYSNATIIGIPVCSLALGEESLLPLFIIISVHNLALFTIGTIIAERGSLTLSNGLNDLVLLLKQLVTNPITGSLIAGGIINYSNIPIYAPLEESLSLIADAAIPSALFVLGASLYRYQIKGHVGSAFLMVTLKILFLPLLVWLLLFQVFTIDPLWASTALVVSAMPVGISAYIFSKKYQACEAPVAAAIVISTLGSALSLSIVLSYVSKVI
ncbi:MAG: AEC family transporter [Gammaproteobacteria bacterium]|nr:AEC family transporter [Gammaproteobacteria bacterium]